MSRERTEVGDIVNQCQKMFTKACIRIIVADIEDSKKLEYFQQLLDNVRKVDELFEKGSSKDDRD